MRFQNSLLATLFFTGVSLNAFALPCSSIGCKEVCSQRYSLSGFRSGSLDLQSIFERTASDLVKIRIKTQSPVTGYTDTLVHIDAKSLGPIKTYFQIVPPTDSNAEKKWGIVEFSDRSIHIYGRPQSVRYGSARRIRWAAQEALPAGQQGDFMRAHWTETAPLSQTNLDVPWEAHFAAADPDTMPYTDSAVDHSTLDVLGTRAVLLPYEIVNFFMLRFLDPSQFPIEGYHFGKSKFKNGRLDSENSQIIDHLTTRVQGPQRQFSTRTSFGDLTGTVTGSVDVNSSRFTELQLNVAKMIISQNIRLASGNCQITQ